MDTRPARRVRGDRALGERLYAGACAGCHGSKGEGADASALSNPVLLQAATDTYFVETIARGRRGTGMAGFARPSPTHPMLSPADIEAVVTFIRSWETGAARPAAVTETAAPSR